MKVLAFDTSSEQCSVALWLDGRVQARQTDAGQRHSELILPMIDALLQEAGVRLRELTGIAFGAGPGSFTGLRIACGVAQGLGFGAGLPVAAVGTLQCLAEASCAERVLSALDARMGEIYIGAYERAPEEWRVVKAAILCRPEGAPSVSGTWVGCGAGFSAHREALQRRYGLQLAEVRDDLLPHAREVAIIGARMLARGEGVDPARAAPLYVRDKVALSVAERAALKRGARPVQP